MLKVFLGGLPVYQFQLLGKFANSLRHGVFSRDGGVSAPPFDSLNVRFGIADAKKNVIINRQRICQALGVKQCISANQTHSDHIQILLDGQLTNNDCDSFDDVDGFITNVPDVPLMVQVADCQALLFFDPVKKVIAAVHAGWKGLTKDIIGVTLRTMQDRFKVDPSMVLVGISPSLGPCCSFFSDPKKELPKNFRPYIDAQKRVDLWRFSKDQLQKHGIQEGNIELAEICTQCDSEKKERSFFSYRGAEGVTGRFAAVIALKV